MKKIRGPIAPLPTGGIIYQITLASGMIITNPAGFGLEEFTIAPIPAIVGENGHVLVSQQQRNNDGDRGRDPLVEPAQ